MNEFLKKIHQQAVRCSRSFQRCQSELIEAIGRVDSKKVFRRLGYASLFEYCLHELKLSEGNAYAFIRVSRKSVEIPEIKKAIEQGTLKVSQARRIVSVINKKNKTEWIEKAQQLTQKQLEREIVKIRPKEAVTESLSPVARDRSRLVCGLSSELESKLKRVQDLLSQKNQRACSLEDALDASLEAFLERSDPVRKAQRSKNGARSLSLSKTRVIPASVRHQVQLRDRGRCTEMQPGLGRCLSKRWLEIHHIRPVALGGGNALGNLATLCWSHHRGRHG